MSANYRIGLPVRAAAAASEVDFGILVLHGAMFLIFALWTIFFAYLLVKYRRRDGVPARRDTFGLGLSLLPDGLILGFELLLVFLYAVPAWTRAKLEPPKDANVIEIVAQQFNWNIRYPGADGKFGRTDAKFIDSFNPLGIDPSDPAGKDDYVSLNDLHLPLGKPTLIRLSSLDVIHSFFIPEFRVKQDAVPGMRVPVWFTPTLEGRFEITCAQLCGVGHAIMRGDVRVHSEAEYKKWLVAASAPPAEAQKAAPIEQW